MANETCKTPEKDEKFFATLAKVGTVGAACRAAHYSRATVYRWRKENEEFLRRWEEADEQYVEMMEAEADRRAVKGTVRPVFYKGAKVGTVREFSDTLLMFRLKAKRPAVYRDNSSVELTGKDGAPLFSWSDLMKSAGESGEASEAGGTPDSHNVDTS